MHQVTISEGIDEQRNHRIDVRVGRWTNVLEHKREGFQDAVLDVEFPHPVLVHQGWQHSERSTCLSHDCNGHCRTHTELSFLYLEVVEEGAQHILWTDCLRDVTELP